MTLVKGKVNMFNPFKKKSEEKLMPTRFFSVAIGEKFVQTALWETNQNVRVLTKSETKPYFNENDLLIKLDGCLQELGPEGEVVHKTLFHLDSAFITGQEISLEKKDLFKKVTESLQLESLGFVANNEAIINAKLEQNPEIEQQVTVEFINGKTIFSLYERKALIDALEIPNQEPFVKQFQSALIQFAGKLGVDYSGYFQEKSELEPSEEGKKTLFANFISSLLSSAEIQTLVDTLPSQLPIKTEILGNEILLPFILIPSATIIAKSYGWIKELVPEAQAEASIPPDLPIKMEEEIRLSRQKDFVPPIVEKSDFPKEKKPPKDMKKVIIGASIGGIIVLVAFAFFWLINQAKVTISLVPKKSNVAKSLEVVIDPKATQADYDKLILPGEILTEEIEHKTSIETTGKKEIGEKSKGKVEIINKKTEEKTIKKGTVLKEGDLTFLTNDEIVVPAAEKSETSSGENITFQKKEVDVTAEEPGDKSNFKKETSLKVGGFSKDEVEAKVVSDFSGGISKTTKVFSAEDEKKALASVAEELQKAAKDKIGTQKGGKYLAVQADKLKINKKSFDVKVGDEADEVELEVMATVPVISYSLEELGPLAKVTLEKELPEGYQFIGSEPSLLSAVDEAKTAKSTDKIYLAVDLSQDVRAQLDLDAIKNQILGIELAKATNILKNSEGIKDFTLTWSNSLTPKITGKMPKASGKVTLESRTDQ